MDLGFNSVWVGPAHHLLIFFLFYSSSLSLYNSHRIESRGRKRKPQLRVRTRCPRCRRLCCSAAPCRGFSPTAPALSAAADYPPHLPPRERYHLIRFHPPPVPPPLFFLPPSFLTQLYNSYKSKVIKKIYLHTNTLREGGWRIRAVKRRTPI